MVDNIKKPTTGPTKSSTQKADDLDAAVPNPDDWCIPNTYEEFTYLTTGPYPIEAMDAFTTSGTLGEMTIMAAPLDEVERGVSMLDGEMVTLLKSYALPYQDDEVERGVSMLDGEMVQLLKSYALPYQDDQVERGVAMLDGTLESLLITITLDPEAFDVTGTLTAGTLLA